jgi:hypothetical protein
MGGGSKYDILCTAYEKEDRKCGEGDENSAICCETQERRLEDGVDGAKSVGCWSEL